MAIIRIERIGGTAGFGGPHLKGIGERRETDLASEELSMIQRLFGIYRKKPKLRDRLLRDGFSYRISWQKESGLETITVPETDMPSPLLLWIVDVLE